MTRDTTTHGYRFIFRCKNGWICRVEFDGYPSRDEATRHLAEILADQGYAVPKWWQWWRRDETQPSDELKSALYAANAAAGMPV